jgi:hypothetical protein
MIHSALPSSSLERPPPHDHGNSRGGGDLMERGIFPDESGFIREVARGEKDQLRLDFEDRVLQRTQL